MADRCRGTMSARTADLLAQIHLHRSGNGSDFCRRYDLFRLVWADHASSITDAITHEKRLEPWRRKWKFALIEYGNPEWRDLFDTMA